jgi:pimeloyl-ACP methyl ester carboxylesterase/DNA-binding CsgD family transcriptional regulator
MDQHIGFCPVDGGRIAYAVTGEGPPLVMPAWWVSHLEVDWQGVAFRRFVEALSERHTVIRYDRLGTGLSDRHRPPQQLTLDHEVDALEALIEETGAESPALFAVSCAGCIATRYAVRRPVASIVFAGSYADGTRIAPDNVERLMIAAVRTHWGMGSRMLADVFMTGAPAEEIAEYERFQRASATPEMAAELLEMVYAASVRDLVPQLDVPALVVHRRKDRAVPFELGRELASLLPGARFVPLEGRTHLPWAGEEAWQILELILRFLGDEEEAPAPAPSEAAAPAPAAPAAPGGDSGLSPRELHVLRLVARGMNDTQIAEELVLSPHTVHRHVANIRTKLRQPTRGAAAAEAVRQGLV